MSAAEHTGTLSVAYQGAPGAFSEAAIGAWFSGRQVATRSERAFADVAAAVLSGAADYGVLPVHNSIQGPVAAAQDVLRAGGLSVVGTVTCPIRLCLLALPGTGIERLRRVLSHPVALNQCGRFLAGMPRVEIVPFYDTAGAAREVADAGDATAAAVASMEAAAHYGLDIVARNVEDSPDNRTRFVIVNASREVQMSRAFVNEDRDDDVPRVHFALPPFNDPSYPRAAAFALVQAASDGHTSDAEEATGYRFGDPSLHRHVKRLLEQEEARPEAEQDRRLITIARRFLR